MCMNVELSNIFWGLVGTGVTALITVLVKMLISYGKQMKALKEGIVWLQHDRLLQTCKFFLRKGTIDADELENLEGLYKSYKSLGGNGTVTRLYERVCGLDIQED